MFHFIWGTDEGCPENLKKSVFLKIPQFFFQVFCKHLSTYTLASSYFIYKCGAYTLAPSYSES